MGFEEGWKEIDRIQGGFCRKVLKIPRCTANVVAELELGWDSRRGRILGMAVKYWLRMLSMDSD
jgi:hypothetical protein